MTPIIRYGEANRAVRDVQHRLVRALDAELAVDGVFGEATREAVRRFQRDRGLAADGIVGPETWLSLIHI